MCAVRVMRELNELGGGREEFGKGSGDAVEEEQCLLFLCYKQWCE